ncbi:MAG TPA: amidohydrolase [Rheinheimera sp.]|uniref:amidohydrolase family protein n=1 Tax=Rheinheimera sp. TaxID=1869214 RepID=UPI000EDDA0F2|nr:amidohydrolase family protein [Rheinheimera sp.]HCU66514.1 amidohydrolase [Rheinheimera sp.]
MNSFRLSVMSAAMVLSIAPVAADQTRPLQGIRDKTPNLLAFVNATVHTEPGKKIDNATVLVEDGRITAVSTAAAPAGYRRIDASGHHIYAGFIDAYSGYGVEKTAGAKAFSFGDDPVYQNERKGGNASNAAIHAERQWAHDFVPVADDAKAYTEQGFTVVQSARQDGIFRGQAVVASLGKGLPGELILKAEGAHFMAFDKGSSKQSYPSSLMGSIALIRQTLSDANWYRDAYGKQDTLISQQPVEFNAALAALAKLPQAGLVFETTDDRAVLRVDSLLKEFNLQNAVLLGSGFEYSRINEIKNTGRSFIMPVAYPEAPAVASIDDQLDVNLAQLRHWERAPANLASMAKAGIPFALTTHALEKKDQFWPNLRKAVNHGLAADKALAALTTVPAAMLGLPQQLGKVAPGYQADLVIAKGDLFKDGEIVATWIRGQEHQFKPLQQPQFAGLYNLNLQGQALKLELTGEGSKLDGKLINGDKNVALKNLSQNDNKLQFTADLTEAAAGSGVLQVSATLDGALLSAQLLLPSGSRQQQMLSKESVPAKASDSKADSDTQLLSKVTYPNRAFGLDAPLTRKNVHIKNATVWTSDKAGKLENTDVIVKDGKFSAIGQNLSTPSGYQVIDATGMHLTAGIIDEHSHIAIEMGVNEGSDAVTSEVQIGDVLDPDDINIYRGLAGGTTTAQLLHGSANPIGGQAQIIQLRWGVTPEGLKFKDAPPSIKFALGENVKQANWGEAFTSRYPQTRIGVETIIRDAFQAAKEYKAAWAAYDNLSRSEKKVTAPPRKDYRLQTLVEILDKQRFVHTHSYVASEILMLIDLADEVGFKVHTFTHILEGYKVADEMKKHGASASTFADWWAYKMEVQDAIPSNTCLMADRGVLVSVNSDSPDLQRRLNQEAAKSVKYCGMSEEEALKMVTINPAIQLNIQDKVGSVTEGKQADFVLWSANPLSVYAQAQQTWIDGVPYYDINRDAQLQQQVLAEKQQLMQKVLGASDAARKGSGGTHKTNEPIWHCEDNGDWLKARFSGGQHLHSHAAL